MSAPTLQPHVEHFRARILQDVLAEATTHYWLRRAAMFEAARPRPSDFLGRASATEYAARDKRLAATAQACRARAAVGLGADDYNLVDQALAEVAA